MPELATLSETSQTVPPPQLLVELPSRRQAFFANLRDLIFPQRLPELTLRSAPAPFWHDVFVKRGLPWLGFLESIAYHTIALTLLVSLGRFLALHPEPVPRPVFDPRTQVIYYDASEYLPPIDTRSTPSAPRAKVDPEYARQPIISVPPEADNRSQTIVTPPNVKLKRDVALPNIVAWANTPQKPRLEIPPAPLTMAAELNRITPQIENSVVAPPPDASHLTHRTTQPNLQTAVVAPPPDLLKSREPGALAPQPAIVAPPPVLDNTSTRQLGELNIGRSSVIAPAPQLPIAEQRAVVSGRGSSGMAPQVVPPSPSVSGAGSGGQVGSPGRVIALNLHPDVGAPPVAPEGNRRGAFAATPEGHAGASGSPGASSGSTSGLDGHSVDGHGNGAGNGVGSNSKGKSDLPAGLYVGSPAAGVKTSAVAGNSSASETTADPVPASAPKPRGSGAPAHAASPESVAKLSEPERAVFGVRGFYSLRVNLPNLNSAGGSWVIRFAELKQDPAAPAGGVTEPVATHMVDPGYPTQLIRENVSGTVIIYGVIRADGTVGDVRVLRSVEDRLDRYACNAVGQWKFQPATKNGAPIEVEATFQIPFRPPKLGTSF
jgi:TonB family protein